MTASTWVEERWASVTTDHLTTGDTIRWRRWRFYYNRLRPIEWNVGVVASDPEVVNGNLVIEVHVFKGQHIVTLTVCTTADNPGFQRYERT